MNKILCRIEAILKPDINEIKVWAIEAGRILKEGFGAEHQVLMKSARDLVTEMDHKAEDYLLGEIRARYPGHAIFTEESGELSGDKANAWYIDPMDGTVNYAHGMPIFSVSIAYALNGIPVMGVIYDPMRDELFFAEKGKGAFLNEKPIYISQKKELIESLMASSFPPCGSPQHERNLKIFAQFTRTAQNVRRLGSAAIDLAYVAAGRLDGYWQLQNNAWDIAAGVLLIQEAGGKVTGIEGNEDFFSPPYSLAAANPVLLPKIVAIIREV